MAAHSEVGLFIDFESIRHGLINRFGLEPDPQGLMEKARRYGPVAVAYAYADFDEHPSHFRRKLEVAGIGARDVPRRGSDASQKSSADMAMLMDIIDCLLDRPHVTTLVLMTGNSDFIRAVARARHRFGKRVIIAGVPGSVSADLIESADDEDPIVDPATARVGAPAARGEEARLLELVTWLAQHRPYMTFGFIRSHALSPHHGLGLTEARITEILSDLKEQGVLIEGTRPSGDGRTLRTLSLDREDERVVEILARGPSRFEEAGREAPSEGEGEGERERESEGEARDAGRAHDDGSAVRAVGSSYADVGPPRPAGSTDGSFGAVDAREDR